MNRPSRALLEAVCAFREIGDEAFLLAGDCLEPDEAQKRGVKLEVAPPDAALASLRHDARLHGFADVLDFLAPVAAQGEAA